jgi:hypothetical protein
MRLFTLIVIFYFASFTLIGQDLVGFKGSEIMKYMKENMKELHSEKVSNAHFSYLKYGDDADSQTLLFFLGKDSVCTSVRLICDPGVKVRKIKEFDSFFSKKEENVWISKRNGIEQRIELKDDDWSCTITFKPAK